MYRKDVPVQLLVQTVCSLLSYLFYSVRGRAEHRRHLRSRRAQHPEKPGPALASRKLASVGGNGIVQINQTQQEQLFKSQIGKPELVRHWRRDLHSK